MLETDAKYIQTCPQFSRDETVCESLLLKDLLKAKPNRELSDCEGLIFGS